MTTEARDRTVSDELLATRVYEAASLLNAALADAWKAGLSANVASRERNEIGRRVQLVVVDVSLMRPL